jgi:DNA-binding GntR family transcriptional regulator
MPLVTRSSLSNEVAETLREKILFGELRPEDRLVQEDLAQQLGVSTMPVREALLKLSHEGFVDAYPNRSFKIRRFLRDDIRDVFWIHSTLVGELAARAAAGGSAELVRSLSRTYELEVKAMRAGNLDDAERLNADFHVAINEAGGSAAVLRLVNDNLKFVPRHLYVHLGQSWIAQSERDHAAILDAIRRKDAEAARKAAVEHPTTVRDFLIAQFTEQGFWPSLDGQNDPRADRVSSPHV